MERKKHRCKCGKIFFEESDNNKCFDCRNNDRYAPAGEVLFGCGI